MACYKPLKAWVNGKTATGKRNIVFKEPIVQPGTYPEEIEIPCGRCIGCRLDYSREWANRCMLELKYHDSAYFITLTYADEFVPIVDAIPQLYEDRREYVDPRTGQVMHYFNKWKYIDPDTGEYLGAVIKNQTLYKRDFQLFMKRLRKKFKNDRIRYYACGEYGGKTQRPHFHAIIFGLHLDDLKQFGSSPKGYKYYVSKAVESCWVDTPARFYLGKDEDGEHKQLGFVGIGNVTWDTCAYTARYMLKKAKGEDAEFYEHNNIVPEFTLMSRKPGIAAQYYADHKDEIYKYDEINLRTEQGGRRMRPPRYFDTLFDIENPAALLAIKEDRRRVAELTATAKLANTTLTKKELLEVEERNKTATIENGLRRSLHG